MAGEAVISFNRNETEYTLLIDGEEITRSEVNTPAERHALQHMAAKNGYSIEYEGENENV